MNARHGNMYWVDPFAMNLMEISWRKTVRKKFGGSNSFCETMSIILLDPGDVCSNFFVEFLSKKLASCKISRENQRRTYMPPYR